MNTILFQKARKKTFEAGLWEALIADVDGGGVSEIIVQTDDGLVRILKG